MVNGGEAYHQDPHRRHRILNSKDLGSRLRWLFGGGLEPRSQPTFAATLIRSDQVSGFNPIWTLSGSMDSIKASCKKKKVENHYSKPTSTFFFFTALVLVMLWKNHPLRGTSRVYWRRIANWKRAEAEEAEQLYLLEIWKLHVCMHARSAKHAWMNGWTDWCTNAYTDVHRRVGTHVCVCVHLCVCVCVYM